ncbi:zinc finger protein OZF-like [Nerophis ophidion]|uniref:zinc finger protein OZF-like n=1 Tax=Nerophis ophidion TaxID=159077 RepID=UPI002AE087C1|nr:zinc finger protein OZF-like [Nerophis ophidion]
MDGSCFAKMTSAKRESERESPTEEKTKTADTEIQKLIGHPEKLHNHLQLGSSTLKQTPQRPHIKEEEEELWIPQEGECLLRPEETDLTDLPLTVVSVKTEDDEEKNPKSFRQLGPEDFRQMIGHPEELPPQPQGRSSTLKQEDPHPPHIKKEEEADCLLGLAEADLAKLPLTVVTVKTEDDDEEKSQADNLLSSDTDCEGDMRTHTDNKHSECSIEKTLKEGLTCLVCAKGFSHKGNLNQHMKTHTMQTVCCSVCGKSFTQNKYLSKHMQTHTGEKLFDCSVCAKRFSLKRYLTEHMKTHVQDKAFCCTVCGKSFYSKLGLSRHTMKHTGEKTFICSVCGKSFYTKSNLVRHERSHTGEKPFRCSVCGKNFSVKSHLSGHMRTHTGEKPFSCSICSKSFFYRHRLTEHHMKHTGEKPFSCAVCGKKFIQKVDIRRHMRTHTGERPFCCAVCDKRFAQKVTMKTHMKTHTGGKN